MRDIYLQGEPFLATHSNEELIALKNGIESTWYRNPKKVDPATKALLLDIYTELRARGVVE